VQSAAGVTLTKDVTDHFTTASYSSLRLAQILAQLGYLPLTWTPGALGSMEQAERATNMPAQSQIDMAYSPPPGTFRWQPGYPSIIRTIWTPSQPNEMITGAIMAFESQHRMTLSETPTAKFWNVLFQAEKQQDRNKVGYTYAIASKALPETLTIWHDGRIVEHTLANTGIAVSPTVDGTFPVYEKFTFQIMRGTNPDGSSYADPVSWVSYFNGGDAVHYFPRGSYGSQQSLGCVELPYNSARQSYPYLTYGSLVTVTG
jgi:L,D-transpeptidase catalytic domain